jgi:hypothetical protein
MRQFKPKKKKGSCGSLYSILFYLTWVMIIGWGSVVLLNPNILKSIQIVPSSSSNFKESILEKSTIASITSNDLEAITSHDTSKHANRDDSMHIVFSTDCSTYQVTALLNNK